jgi:hypothetical protein
VIHPNGGWWQSIIVSEHAGIQIKKFIILKRGRCMQIGLPQDKNRNCRTNEKIEIASLPLYAIWDSVYSSNHHCRSLFSLVFFKGVFG